MFTTAGFDVCAEGVEPSVVVVDPASRPDPISRSPSEVIVAIDQQGLLPPADPGDFDLMLTTAQVPPGKRGWINVIDPELEVVRLRDAMQRHGRPAAVLAQVLRAGVGRAAADVLLVESLAYSMLLGGREFRAWLQARPKRASRSPESDTRIRLTRSDEVLSLHLANPKRRNAFDARMRDAMVEALAFARVDPTIAAVELRADGTDFCSGGDLDEFGTSDDLSLAHAIRMLRSPVRLLASMTMPTTAFVHGACVGAGIEIPAAATRVVARPDARFWLPELAMGLIPGAGGTLTLALRIGRHRLLHWALCGERIDARTALDWGLVDDVVADQAL